MLLFLLACQGSSFHAEFGSTVTVDPAQLSYFAGCRSPHCQGSCALDDYTNGGAYLESCDPVDDFGDAVRFNALVIDPDSLPVQGATVTIQSQIPTMYVIPESGVQIADGSFAACEADPSLDGCQEFFYADNLGTFFQISPSLGAPDGGDTAGSFHPTFAQVETDRYGLATFWVFADQIPFPGSTSSIFVSIGTAGTNIEIATGD